MSYFNLLSKLLVTQILHIFHFLESYKLHLKIDHEFEMVEKANVSVANETGSLYPTMILIKQKRLDL